MTICARNEKGDVVFRREVSTRPEKVTEFFQELRQQSDDGQFAVLLEVCGFHDWLVKRLNGEEGCRAVLLIQPEQRSRQKTDRRDASKLGELLWVNRQRLLAGEKVNGVRTVYFPTDGERQERQLTAFREAMGWRRTETINQIRHILRRNNLEWERPTKSFQTQKVKRWLVTLSLDEVDRWEMDRLLEQWELWERELTESESKIKERAENNASCRLLMTIVGVGSYMALAITSRIGDIKRFPTPRSLANFFGLTPGSRSSGQTQRTGSITKQGSRIVRFLLGQLVLHLLRRDGKMRLWYQRIKQRRGSKIARVAVMRRLTVILWHMLTKQEAYRYGEAPQRTRPRRDDPAMACQEPEHPAQTEIREAAPPKGAKKTSRARPKREALAAACQEPERAARKETSKKTPAKAAKKTSRARPKRDAAAAASAEAERPARTKTSEKAAAKAAKKTSRAGRTGSSSLVTE
jgi:transposase